MQEGGDLVYCYEKEKFMRIEQSLNHSNGKYTVGSDYNKHKKKKSYNLTYFPSIYNLSGSDLLKLAHLPSFLSSFILPICNFLF